ncbi:hypothetical protein AB0M45_32325 [Nocardia sp. NPDC051787]|uniref:hypothetical protein n=1 Tax=Nocardia sp. NPDC051787 TaxID=3155415 RepID=UPI00342CEE45
MDYALDKESMEHVFVPKHKLDGLVKFVGGEEATMTKIIESVQGVPNGVYNGSNPLVRTINGQTVHIRGAMIDGVFKIGTAYIP